MEPSASGTGTSAYGTLANSTLVDGASVDGASADGASGVPQALDIGHYGPGARHKRKFDYI